MQIINSVKIFFSNLENRVLTLLSLILTVVALVHLFQKMGFVFFTEVFYIHYNLIHFLYPFLTLLMGITIFYFSRKIYSRTTLKKLLFALLVPEIIFLFGLQKIIIYNSLVGLMAVGYFLLLILYIISSKNKEPEKASENRKKGVDYLASIVIAIVVIINFNASFYHLGKFAAVDEPLWTFQRIPDFWKNFGDLNWYKSRVSDKPGLTVALISGTGLLMESNPKNFKNAFKAENITDQDIQKMEHFNLIFRLPIVIFTALLLPLIYLFVKKLVNRSSALIATIFIGLSPILIGNSRIINPDALLWIFSFLAFLSYLINLKNEKVKYLYLSSFFLGLALLTKYTANILYIFFFGLIFLEYIFNPSRYALESAGVYLKKMLRRYFTLVILSFSTFFVLYPAVWEKPDRVFLGTIFSQPFLPIWPLFATTLAVILLDVFILKSYFLSLILKFISQKRTALLWCFCALFLLLIVIVFANTHSQMKFLDFENILSSPKSAFKNAGILGTFITNFYPLIFSVSPFALLPLILFLIIALIRKKFDDFNFILVFYSLLFILTYYLGSAVSKVASTIRYQIILYPVLFLAAGIAASEIWKIISPKIILLQKYKKHKLFFCLVLIFLLAYPIYKTAPLYMGYASSLLPQQYSVDLKDMGEGSYEAAQYLNSLPEAKNLRIWTDKKGVCNFFKGKCYTALVSSFFLDNELDYFVLSSGRENRTVNITKDKKRLPLSFKNLYTSEDFVYKLEIGGRPNNFIKIISADKIFE